MRVEPPHEPPAPSRAKLDLAPFLLVAVIATLTRAVLLPFDLLGWAIAWGIAGLLCGWVLRTRLPDLSRRVLVIVVSAAVFFVCGPWVELAPPEWGLSARATYAMLSWAPAGAIIGLTYVSRGALLAAPALAALSFAAAGAATQLIELVETPWDPLPLTLLHVLVIVGFGGALCDYSCRSLGLASRAHGLARLGRSH